MFKFNKPKMIKDLLVTEIIERSSVVEIMESLVESSYVSGRTKEQVSVELYFQQENLKNLKSFMRTEQSVKEGEFNQPSQIH